MSDDAAPNQEISSGYMKSNRQKHTVLCFTFSDFWYNLLVCYVAQEVSCCVHIHVQYINMIIWQYLYVYYVNIAFHFHLALNKCKWSFWHYCQQIGTGQCLNNKDVTMTVSLKWCQWQLGNQCDSCVSCFLHFVFDTHHLKNSVAWSISSPLLKD